MEEKILGRIFGNLFVPHRLAYLSKAVDAAIARALEDPQTGLRRREADLSSRRAPSWHTSRMPSDRDSHSDDARSIED